MGPVKVVSWGGLCLPRTMCACWTKVRERSTRLLSQTWSLIRDRKFISSPNFIYWAKSLSPAKGYLGNSSTLWAWKKGEQWTTAKGERFPWQQTTTKVEPFLTFSRRVTDPSVHVYVYELDVSNARIAPVARLDEDKQLHRTTSVGNECRGTFLNECLKLKLLLLNLPEYRDLENWAPSNMFGLRQ